LRDRVSAASRWPPSTPPPTEELVCIASNQKFKSILSHR
jgi:hypothetical protein